jgi:hypothetical protein
MWGRSTAYDCNQSRHGPSLVLGFETIPTGKAFFSYLVVIQHIQHVVKGPLVDRL